MQFIPLPLNRPQHRQAGDAATGSPRNAGSCPTTLTSRASASHRHSSQQEEDGKGVCKDSLMP